MIINKNIKPTWNGDFIHNYWDRSMTYIKSVVDVVCEPLLILDKDLRIITANEPFYKTFLVLEKNIEGKKVYEIGNGQWDIPVLKKLLEDILPKQTFFKGFEVACEFPLIGKRVMILNARQIYIQDESVNHQSIILLAMEDITEMIGVADMFVQHAKNLEIKIANNAK